MNYKLFLRGAGQVMFQDNALTGLLIVLGIFWGGYECGHPIIGWTAVVGLFTATIVGILLDRKADDTKHGLYGFNGILVGCAFGTFINCTTWQMWMALILCSAATVWLRNGMNKVFKKWGINSLTMPFVLIMWIMLLATREFGALSHTSLTEPTLYPHTSLPFNVNSVTLFIAWLKGISQVFLLNSVGAGIFFIIALACCSLAASCWAMLASALSLWAAIAFGADGGAIYAGMYGYSPVLTAIALGCTFYKPGIKSALWCFVGILATVLVQAGMYALMLPYGIATLTAPFCITTWVFLLPRYAFNTKEQPDHTRWHKSEAA
jgi:urea transporter